jgi:hypothetical protein
LSEREAQVPFLTDDGVGSIKRDWLVSLTDATTVSHPPLCAKKPLDNERLNSHLMINMKLWAQSKRHGSTS